MVAARIPEVHVHVHIHNDSDNKLDQILETLQVLDAKGNDMAADLTALTNEVAETGTVVQSAVALINGFGAQLDALLAEAEAGQVNVEAIQSLRDSLDASNQELADAIAANTPEANPPVDPEEPPVDVPPVDDGIPVPPADGADDGVPSPDPTP